MKKFLLVLSFAAYVTFAQAQKLTGLWYSADSSRVYEIKEFSNNKFFATLKSTQRKTDSIGYVVLQNLTYIKRKKRYEGIIYSVTDGRPVFVKIKFNKHNSNKIVLKLNRMFVMDVAINWARAAV